MVAVGVSAAQAPKPAVESPLTRQLHQALSLAEKGDKKQAMELADALLAQHPEFEPALKLKGMLLEDAGRQYEAGEAYQKALKLAPNDADLLFKIGIYQLVAGDKEKAVELLEHHLKLAPKDADALYYLSQAYHLTGNDDRALKAIEQCAKIEPDNASVLQKYGELLCSSGDCEAGVQWLLKARRADATLPRIDFAISVASFRNMDFQGAKSYSEKAAEQQPNDPNVLALLGSVEVKLSEWQAAKGTLEHVVTMRPDDVASMLELGHCELELGNYQSAIDTLDHMLKLDPTQIIAHFYLSRAYAGLGKTAESRHEAELHHKMMDQTTFVPSFESSGRDGSIQGPARKLLADHREEEARKLFLDTFKGDTPTPASAYVFIGKLYLFMGDTEDGLRSLQQALQMEPTVRGAHTFEGILALKQGDLDKAEKEFQAELANDPNYQTAIAEMGEVRYRQGRWADAAQQLEKSRTMVPQLLYMECDSYFHSGDVKNADLTAETLAAYGRSAPDVMKGLMELLNRNGQVDLAQRISENLKP
jgi:Tfp pilus assembly protein PilF